MTKSKAAILIAVLLLAAGVALFISYQGLKEQHRRACISNLRMIDANKQQWALEQRKQPTEMAPSLSNLWFYFYGRDWEHSGDHQPFTAWIPTCPSGGTYTVGRVRDLPTCTIPGHVFLRGYSIPEHYGG